MGYRDTLWTRICKWHSTIAETFDFTKLAIQHLCVFFTIYNLSVAKYTFCFLIILAMEFHLVVVATSNLFP